MRITRVADAEIAQWKNLNLWMLNVRSSKFLRRKDLMARYGLSAKEANRLILDSLLVSGQELVWESDSA